MPDIVILCPNCGSEETVDQNQDYFKCHHCFRTFPLKESKTVLDSTLRRRLDDAITKRNGFFTNSSINNSYSRNVDVSNNKKSMKKNKKFTWWNYILFTFTIKKNNFLEFLKNKREDYISEEKLLELTFFYEKNYDFKKDYEKLETNNMEDNNIYNISTNTITPVPLTLNK